MADAFAWLQANFGRRRAAADGGGSAPRRAPPNLSMPFTPRGAAGGGAQYAREADDAVFHAAMNATLATPRAPTATASVDDTPMAGAVNKMFKNRQSV